VNIFSNLTVNDTLMAAVIIGQIAMFFWIKPLRDAKEQVDQLKKEVGELNLDKLRADMKLALEMELDRLVPADLCAARMDTTDGAVAQIQQDRRDSVMKLHNKIDAMTKDLHLRIDLLAASCSKGFQDIERSIGRLEGKAR
jgi:hypothetical protein